MIFAMTVWIALAATYLVFAGQASGHELMAGLGASLAAAGYAIVAHRAAGAPLRLRVRWFHVAATVAKSLVVDTIRVAPALLRGKPGSLSRQTIPAEAGARGVAILASSVAPNGFVVSTQRQEAVLHRLVDAEPPS
jgi:multisubunit Na+/H+ antiporter MnhE subunit